MQIGELCPIGICKTRKSSLLLFCLSLLSAVRNKVTFLLCLIILIGATILPATAQDVTAARHLHTLKNGVLLVRLHTRQATIDRMRENGQKEAAANIELTQRRKNKAIANAFVEQYKFSPVLFFLSTQTELVREGRFDEVNFLNYNLEIDTTQKLNGRKYLIAEFANIERSDYKKTDKRTKVESTYTDATTLEIGALFVQNAKFERLPDPFPYVRSFESLDSRPVSKTVKRLEKKLNQLYKRNAELMAKFDKQSAAANP